MVLDGFFFLRLTELVSFAMKYSQTNERFKYLYACPKREWNPQHATYGDRGKVICPIQTKLTFC